MILKEILNYLYRFLRNISIKLPAINIIFIKLDFLRSPNKELFSTHSRNIKRSTLYSYNIFNSTINLIKYFDKNYTLKNKTILEIGPGDNFLLAYLFLLNGAKKVYLVDRFKTNITKSFNLKLYEYYIKKYVNLKNFISLSNKIYYFSNTPFEKLNKIKKESIDLIFSQAVLEHVFDLNSTIKKISLLLKKGGYTIHQVDLNDHLHLNDKSYLDFLKYPHRFYKYFGDITNRKRFSQYINYFNVYHLKILDIINIKKVGPISKINKIKKKFYRDFRNLSDEELSIISFKIIAKK